MSPLAARLLDHAARVMPQERRAWAKGMQAELSHISNPAAAIAFALGCVRVSYTQRIQDMMTVARLSRWALAAFALVCAGTYLLATALLGAIKATPEITPEDLGSDPGTAESLSFIQAYPAWQLAVFVVIAAVLMAGAVLLVRRKPAALPLFVSAAAIATLVALLDRRLVGAADWPLAWSSGWLIPLLCLAPIWWLSRRAPDLKTV